MIALLLFLLLALPCSAQGWWETDGPWQDELRRWDILFLGERHDRAEDHEMQRQVLEALGPVVAGAEMFQIPFQPALDRFSRGELDLEGLRRETNWEKTWGHDYKLYAPCWEAVQRNKGELLALRYATGVNRRLGAEGPQAVPAEQRPLAAFDEWDYGGDEDRLYETYAAHGKPSEEGFRRFLRVQTLWEEGMAGRLAARYKPGQPMVVLVGSGHLTQGYGLPFRTRRLLRARGLERLPRCGVVLCDPDERDRERADVVYHSRGANP